MYGEKACSTRSPGGGCRRWCSTPSPRSTSAAGGAAVALRPWQRSGRHVVYVPDTRTAWTGNYLVTPGSRRCCCKAVRSRTSLPWRRCETPCRTWADRCGTRPDGRRARRDRWLIGYLTRLDGEVATAHAAGRSLAETIAASTDPWAGGSTPALAAELARYPVSAARAKQGMLRPLPQPAPAQHHGHLPAVRGGGRGQNTRMTDMSDSNEGNRMRS